jgi:ribose transport system permease protein
MTSPSRTESLNKPSFLRTASALWQKYYIIIVFLVMAGLSTAISPEFFSWINISNILKQSAVPGIVSLGMLMVVMTAGIDLSVGSIVALTGVLAVGLQRNMPLVPAVLLALCVGLLAGAINGLLVTKRNMPPFIATLGMMAVARGLTYVYTRGGPIQITYPAFNVLGRGYIGPIPVIVVLWLILAFLVGLVLTRTTFGRSITAVGSNSQAVYLSGINVGRHLLAVYMISGLLCGLAGTFLASRLTVGTPLMGSGMELDAIAAVVIGGASLAGGRGTAWGTVVGVLILGMISNMLNLVGVGMFYQDAVRGIIIILAVLFRGTSR